MIKTLQKHGNSQALVIDRSLMEALSITAETPLQVTVTGDTLVIRPVNVGAGRDEVAESLRKMRPRYSQMLKHLAE
jgi:antitoxin component of MazEF toxin-antitoxin module